MTFEGSEEMFEGDFIDKCANKFSLMSMGGRAKGLACADLEAWTPIGVSRNLLGVCHQTKKHKAKLDWTQLSDH